MMRASPGRRTDLTIARRPAFVCLALLGAILAVALAVPPAVAGSSGPSVLAVTTRSLPDNVLEITATVYSSVGIDHVNLSYSASPDSSLGPPVRMAFASADVAAETYNYTLDLTWTATYIRMQIVAQDTNGIQSEPSLATVTWSTRTVEASQPLFPGAIFVYGIAALAALGALGAAMVLRRFVRPREP